ncbi:MAG: BBP7 family outer membrane beta-barrel protein [Pirellulales bacterium]|nr:BBP7 family outer membrane beta-barrel protein [Pirellulales bacterium]
MKKLILLLVVGASSICEPAIAVQSILAPSRPIQTEDLPPPLRMVQPSGDGVGNPFLDDLPPELELSVPTDEGSGTRLDEPEASAETQLNRSPEPLPTDNLAGPGTNNDPHVFACDPALLESTGTWLRRGFWSAEFDITFFDRIWRKDPMVLIGENGTSNALIVDGGVSGAEASPRLKVSRFFFRDHMNRDHTAEMIFYGGGQWTQIARLDAAQTSLTTAGSGGNASFTGATSSQFEYNNRFNDFELNYHLKTRMRNDRMELEPSGRWVRRAQPSSTCSLIAGIRYFDVNEDFSWDAFGIPDADTDGITETGNYRIRSDNDLIGAQGGFSWTHERARWSLGVRTKGGLYWNHTNVNSTFGVSGGITAGGSQVEVDNLSFIVEASLLGKWHLRPNLSLRTGLEMLYVSSIAHAVEHANFIPISTGQGVATGDSTYMGGTFGFEQYW